MKIEELKTKSENELAKMLHEGRESLRNFRFGLSGGKTKNIKEGRNLRKEIARILTELKLRQ